MGAKSILDVTEPDPPGVYIAVMELMEISEPDGALARRCLEGDREAFAGLVERYQHPVYNLALRMTRNHAEADDVAQEAFLRAYRKLEQYDAKYPFGHWVMGICANLARNRFRSWSRRRRAEEAHLDLNVPGRVAADPRQAAVEQALARLSHTLRAPVILKHVEGLDYDEISRVLDIGVSAAKMRVKRGLAALAEWLGAEGKAVNDEAG